MTGDWYQIRQEGWCQIRQGGWCQIGRRAGAQYDGGLCQIWQGTGTKYRGGLAPKTTEGLVTKMCLHCYTYREYSTSHCMYFVHKSFNGWVFSGKETRKEKIREFFLLTSDPCLRPKPRLYLQHNTVLTYVWLRSCIHISLRSRSLLSLDILEEKLTSLLFKLTELLYILTIMWTKLSLDKQDVIKIATKCVLVQHTLM